MADTLLTYEVEAEPAMIHASPEDGEPSLVTLSIHVTNGTRPIQSVECKSIRFDFPKGISAQNLFWDEDDITLNAPPDWSFTQHGSSFTATPEPNTEAGNISRPQVFQLANIKVNARPGIAQFTITEETGPSRLTGTRKVTLAKFPEDSDTLLTYGDPDPASVEISAPDGDATLADLTISVSNSIHVPVDCKSISFQFQQGTSGSDLFSPGDAAAIETDVESGWDISRGAVFTATPSTGNDGRIGGRGVPFKFKNIKVNQQVGTTAITITEVTNVDVNHTGTVVKELGKSPLTLQITDFSATPAIMDQGSKTTLRWDVTSDATVWIEYLNEANETVTTPNLPAHGTYAVTLQKGTTFHLYASRTGEAQVNHKEFPVDVTPTKPRINLFEGTLTSLIRNRVILKWDASHTAYCKLTDNDGELDAKADAHPVDLTSADPASKTFTLTALDNGQLHSDSVDLTVNCRFEELKAAAAGALGPYTFGMAVAGDDQRVFVLGSGGGQEATLQVFNSRTLEKIGDSIPLAPHPWSLTISPDRQRIYAVIETSVWAFNATTLQRIGDPTDTGSCWGRVAVSADGARVLVIGALSYVDGSIWRLKQIDAHTLQPIGDSIDVRASVMSIAASSTGKFYLGCDDKTLRVFATDTLQSIGDPIPVAAVPQGLAISPDGKIIYMVGDDNMLRAIDVDQHNPLGDPVNLGSAYQSGIAISPNGEHLYVTDDGANLKRFLAFAVYNPVKIKSFRANPSHVEMGDNSDSSTVQLDWETVSATGVRLNDQLITGSSTSVSIDNTTQFTLEAKGGGGPVSETLTVEVIRPVKIGHFGASATVLYRNGNSVDVTLDWTVRNATQVTLNGEVVTGNSKTISIQQTTTLTLAATGKDGPATSDVTVVVKQINLVVTSSDSAILATFSADAGTYSVKFVLHYTHLYGAGYYIDTEESTVVVTSAGDNQPLSAETLLTHRFPTYCSGADVTVTGFPGGPVSAKLGPTT